MKLTMNQIRSIKLCADSLPADSKFYLNKAKGEKAVRLKAWTEGRRFSSAGQPELGETTTLISNVFVIDKDGGSVRL